MVDRRGWPEVALRALIPPLLVLASVRLLLTPLFLEVEYRLPGFPADPYGFGIEDRLRLAPLALDYLFEPAPSRSLADLTAADGTPLFNTREVQHMEDVRRLAQSAFRFAWIAGLVAVGSAAWVLSRKGVSGLAASLQAGAKATFFLVAGFGLLLVVSFPLFFTGFHRLFFQGDTWLFAYSDTLIRLFPVRFWRDASIAVGLLTLAGAGGLYASSRIALGRVQPLSKSG